MLVTKFVAGAWIVAVAIPTGAVLLGLRRRSHLSERQQMAVSVAELAAPMRSHHQVVVLVEDLHAGVAEALRYARSLDPLGPADRQTEIMAVHVVTDPAAADRLSTAWTAIDLEVNLTVIACPDRDLGRALGEWLVSQSRPDQELTVILPLIRPARWWDRLS